MHQDLLSGSAKAGTIGGTCCGLLAVIAVQDLLHSAAIAAIGAAVSCTVSLLFRYLARLFHGSGSKEE